MHRKTAISMNSVHLINKNLIYAPGDTNRTIKRTIKRTAKRNIYRGNKEKDKTAVQ